MDRISNLPCNVIDDILKHLELHESARTSILSRQWRYKWLSIPYLVFDWEFQGKLRRKFTMASIVYQLLLLHKGSIVKFVVDAHIKDFLWSMITFTGDVDHWLHFLSKHPIEELSLRFPNPEIPKIPNHLFSFGQLKHLKLAYCNVKPPCSFKGFGKLLVLDLCNVSIEHAELKSFISKCPLLEHLTLSGDSLPCLRIHAPNLKSFNLAVGHECPCPEVWLKSTSFLKDVTIFTRDSLIPEEIPLSSHINLIKFLRQLTSVKKLELNQGAIMCLGCMGVPLMIRSPSLSHLTRLICHVPFEIRFAVRCVVCLIGITTNLPCLEIRADTSVNDDNSLTIEYLKEQQELNHSLCHLKHVKIDNFAGDQAEMEFVKLILLAATSLVTLELKLRPNLEGSSSEQGYMMFRSLATFRRASANVQIII